MIRYTRHRWGRAIHYSIYDIVYSLRVLVGRSRRMVLYAVIQYFLAFLDSKIVRAFADPSISDFHEAVITVIPFFLMLTS